MRAREALPPALTQSVRHFQSHCLVFCNDLMKLRLYTSWVLIFVVPTLASRQHLLRKHQPTVRCVQKDNPKIWTHICRIRCNLTNNNAWQFSRYVPSAWEEEWIANRETWNGQVCETLLTCVRVFALVCVSPVLSQFSTGKLTRAGNGSTTLRRCTTRSRSSTPLICTSWILLCGLPWSIPTRACLILIPTTS